MFVVCALISLISIVGSTPRTPHPHPQLPCNLEENPLLNTLGDSFTNEEYVSAKRGILHNREDATSCYRSWFQPPFFSMARCNPDLRLCECTESTEMDVNGLCHPDVNSIWGSRCDLERWSMYFSKTIGPMMALMEKVSTPQSVFNAAYYLLYMEYRFIESHLGVPGDAKDACVNTHYFLECVQNTTRTWNCGKCHSRPPYFNYRQDKMKEKGHYCVAQNASVCLLILHNIGEDLSYSATFINTTCDGDLECLPVPNLDFRGLMDLKTCGGFPWTPVGLKSSASSNNYQRLLEFMLAISLNFLFI